MIHHYPSLARLVSLQVADIRIIFDDLDGLELTLRDFCLGVKVNFDGKVDNFVPPSPSTPSSLPGEDIRRAHPLSPEDETMSPSTSFSYFSHLNISPTKAAAALSGYARLVHASQRASHIHDRMTTTAGQVWSRTIARARGSVSFAASIRDAAMILPHVDHPPTMTVRNSIPDVMPHPPSNGNGITEKHSNRSLRSGLGSHRPPHSFASVSSFRTLLRSSAPKYALPCPEGGYEKLLVVEGESRAVFDLGFGPQKGLLGEDTLRTSLVIGRLHTNLGATDKLQELAKAHSNMPEKTETETKQDNWGPRSMPRVSRLSSDWCITDECRFCCELLSPSQ